MHQEDHKDFLKALAKLCKEYGVSDWRFVTYNDADDPDYVAGIVLGLPIFVGDVIDTMDRDMDLILEDEVQQIGNFFAGR